MGAWQTVAKVELDFGSSAFNGQPRWMGIAARCPAKFGAYTNLGRQAVLPTPYALYAQNAGALGGQPDSYYQARVQGIC